MVAARLKVGGGKGGKGDSKSPGLVKLKGGRGYLSKKKTT